MDQPSDERTLHERVGGLPAFIELVDRFYDRVEADPVLRPVYPDDLGPGKTALAEFFSQYWGGPPVYSQTRGHPRLRRRHNAFTVTPQGAQRWIANMTDAIRSMGWPDDIESAFVGYVVTFAPQMINAHEVPDRPLPLA